MPTKKTSAIVPIEARFAASLIARFGKDKPYHSYVDERPDIRCDKCGAHVGDDGQYDPYSYSNELWVE